MNLNSPLPSCYLADLGRAQYQAGRFEEAIATYDRMPLSEYGASEHVYRAASYVGLDRNEAARKEIAKAMTMDPDMTGLGPGCSLTRGWMSSSPLMHLSGSLFSPQ
jgi:tetratricopeptide (TPR) repeat protein